MIVLSAVGRCVLYRYSEKVLNRRNVNETKLEYTTEQIRQELADKEALLKSSGLATADPSSSSSNLTESASKNDDNNKTEAINSSDTTTTTIVEEQAAKQLECENVDCDDSKLAHNAEISASDNQKSNTKDTETTKNVQNEADEELASSTKEPLETKSKKKRRKKSMMKKKASMTMNAANAPPPRKSSSSSSAGSAEQNLPSDPNDIDADSNQQSSNATSASIDDLAKSEVAVTAQDVTNETSAVLEPMETPRMCDFHFFSDTEVATSPYGSRPSTPIQSDSEFEISQRDNLVKIEKNSDPMSSSTASWKWGEFPITPVKTDADTNGLNKEARQADRNSTLNTMLSFMKETMKLRKNTSEGVYLSDLMDTEGMDPDVLAKYFPPTKDHTFISTDGDDHESGNGTSLPHSPSSLENGASKSIEFDFDNDNKLYDK